MKILKPLMAFVKPLYFTTDAPTPIPTPPPVAPPPETAPTLETTPTDVKKKKAQTQGAKSLQIPLGSIGGNKPLNI